MYSCFLLLLCRVPPATSLDLLAASTITACTNSGQGASNCSFKLLISAAINSAEVYGTGSFMYDLASSLPPAASVIPLDAVTLTLTQSSIKYFYPLAYVQDFNDAPYEVVSVVDANNRAFNPITNACQDKPTSASPACGWATLPSGAHVPFSQGFCCNCNVEMDFTGGSIPRSGLNCQAFSAQQASASCLRMGPLWWSGFSIGPPSLNFHINIHVDRCRPTPAALAMGAFNATAAVISAALSAGVPVSPAALAAAAAAPQLTCSSPSIYCACESFDTLVSDTIAGLPPLGTEMPQRCYALPGSPPSSCDVLFTLIGTFVPLAGVPDLSSKMLLIPTQCDLSASTPGWVTNPCFTALVSGWSQWLLVDKTLITLDGATCNKVGTSYEAFNTQGSACQSPRGTCLGGSPAQLLLSDLGRMSSGLKPRYLLSAFTSPTAPSGITPLPRGGDSGVQALQASALGVHASSPASSSQLLSLVLPTGDFQKSLFTLLLQASPNSFRLVTNVASGVILGVGYEAFTAGNVGALAVAIGNTGGISSSFTLVAICSPPSLPIEGKAVAVSAGGVMNTSFPIAVFGTSAADIQCNITLLNSLGGVADFKRGVGVRVGGLVTNKGTQGGTIVGGIGGTTLPTNSSDSAGACGQSCSSWIDLPCALKSASACVERLAMFATTGFFTVLGALLAAYCLFKNPGILLSLGKALQSLLCCGGGDEKKPATSAPAAEASPPPTHTTTAPRLRQGRVVTHSSPLAQFRSVPPSQHSAAPSTSNTVINPLPLTLQGSSQLLSSSSSSLSSYSSPSSSSSFTSPHPTPHLSFAQTHVSQTLRPTLLSPRVTV
jgi:hypothetical protein